MSALSTLETWLHPVSAGEFAATYWDTQHLYVEGNEARARELQFGLADFWRVAERPGVTFAAQFHGRRGHHEIVDLPGDRARGLFEQGMTIAINNLERYHPPFAQLAGDARMALGYPGHVSVAGFVSPSDAGYGVHFDQHGAMALQLEGEKTWHHSLTRAVEAPPDNLLARAEDMAQFAAKWPLLAPTPPVEAELFPRTLRPGDLLYLPPGTWHRPVATGYSVAITLIFHATRFETLVNQVLRTRLGASVGWRSLLPLAPERDRPIEGLPRTVHAFFEARLQELRDELERLTPADLAMAWRQLLCAPGARSTGYAIGDGSVADDDVVEVPRPLWLHPSAKDPEVLQVFSGHRSVFLPSAASPMLKLLDERSSWSVAELLGAVSTHELERDEVEALLGLLAEAGFVSLRRPAHR